ncbi:dipeptide epimerase [Bacteroidetes bacterium SCGC AAA795-G10]|nr:dipeptide epimerase [Bacteroidetes bacterium SCGC AAA795-G10]
MKITFYKVRLKKRFPLAISRGVRYDSENLFVKYDKEGITGWGEAAPGKSEGAESVMKVKQALEKFISTGINNFSIQELYDRSRELKTPPCAYVGLDTALWDWQAKKEGLPLYKLLGFPRPKTPTSVTIGINPPEVVKERIPILLEGTTVKSLKIKLGSVDGIQADKLMFEQVVKSTKNYNVKIRVDANGGWNIADAKHMMQWLADREVDYVEQPLKEGEEFNLEELYENRPVPIYLDETCRFSENISSFAHCVDGVNMKLMKCGGITEALKIIKTARKYKLKTMIGCMSESSVSIAAAAALSGGIDHIDLDSHYNLAPDPSTGAPMVDGVTLPPDIPGHGGELKKEFYA